MILGHDFHAEAGFKESFDRGGEVIVKRGRRIMGPTWRNLIALLEEARINPADCFFTNAYMGLRVGSGTTGPFPGSTDSGFVERCRKFLALQIRTMRPRAILTLGAWVPAFIAPLSSELEGWANVGSLGGIDKAGPMVPDARFPDAPGVVCPVGALTHPSLRGPNVHRRCYGGDCGHPAELRLIGDVILRSDSYKTD